VRLPIAVSAVHNTYLPVLLSATQNLLPGVVEEVDSKGHSGRKPESKRWLPALPTARVAPGTG